MNTSKNLVQLIGHVQCPPKTIALSNGHLVCRFSILADESPHPYELSSDVQVYRVVAWDHTAEIAEALLCKELRVAIEGRLLTIRDPEETISRSEIEVRDMVILCNHLRPNKS